MRADNDLVDVRHQREHGRISDHGRVDACNQTTAEQRTQRSARELGSERRINAPISDSILAILCPSYLHDKKHPHRISPRPGRTELK